MGRVERGMRAHFERKIRDVPVTVPMLTAVLESSGGRDARHRGRFPPPLVDSLVRTAMVVVAIGSFGVLACAMPHSSTLAWTITVIARERAYERLLPGSACIMDLIEKSFGKGEMK
jgi:hypothetical protein